MPHNGVCVRAVALYPFSLRACVSPTARIIMGVFMSLLRKSTGVGAAIASAKRPLGALLILDMPSYFSLWVFCVVYKAIFGAALVRSRRGGPPSIAVSNFIVSP